MTRTGPLPSEAETRQALQAMAELQTLSQGMDEATRRGGHAPEIRTLLGAASGDDGAVQIHGFRLRPPSFGALQILDEIDSPLLVGGAVKLGQIAAAVCILEDPDGCWKMLSGTDGAHVFDAHVWQRTKILPPRVATEISEIMIRLIREACGLPTGEEATAGNGAEGAATAPAPTPVGSPVSSTGSVPTTDSPSTTPSGGSPPPPPAASSMPAPSVPAAPLPVLLPLTAPASPPSAPSGPPALMDDGHTFASHEDWLRYQSHTGGGGIR